MTQGSIPSLYEWAGGAPAFERLTEIFYRRVEDEPLLAALFAKAEPGHATYVAQFIGEVFGGPKRYSEDHRGHTNMIEHHLEKRLTEEQRRPSGVTPTRCWRRGASARRRSRRYGQAARPAERR